MGWTIKCHDDKCNQETWATNIVDLIQNHRDESGWFLCSSCNGHGYIKKSFSLQEHGQTWNPFLRGIITLGVPGDTYQPFVFIVSNTPEEDPDDFWFSYYKDTRKQEGGRLKLGYGPGGPPVLSTEQIIQLMKTMSNLELIEANTLKDI